MPFALFDTFSTVKLQISFLFWFSAGKCWRCVKERKLISPLEAHTFPIRDSHAYKRSGHEKLRFADGAFCSLWLLLDGQPSNFLPILISSLTNIEDVKMKNLYLFFQLCILMVWRSLCVLNVSMKYRCYPEGMWYFTQS